MRRRKPSRPRRRPSGRSRREQPRKLDRTAVGKITVRKISNESKPIIVTRQNVRRTRVRNPSIKIVEDNQLDPGKEPTYFIGSVTDKDNKTGEIPTDPEDLLDYSLGDEESDPSLSYFDPIAVRNQLFSYNAMREKAIIEITKTTTDNLPIANSVNDPRFGPYDPLEVCEECNQSDCNGHYGIIKFPDEYPVPNPILLGPISQVLNCVCNSCGKLLLSRETLESKGILRLKGSARFDAVIDRCQGPLKCSEGSKSARMGETVEFDDEGGEEVLKIKTGVQKVCSANFKFYPQHSKTHGWVAYRISDEKEYNMLDPKKVFDILDAISDEDAELLGFTAPNHPRNMVLRALLVFPTSGRAPFIQGATVKCDQLTEFFNRIIRAKDKLINEDSLGGKCECYKEMASAVKDLMDGNKSPYNNRPVMPLRSRIQGKNGIPRRFMMGKRTDYCARTVLGPGGDIRFGQIRVPKRIADTIPLRVTVFEYNKRAVEEMIEQGKILFFKQPKDEKFTKYRPGTTFPVRIGTVVDRKLQCGDRIAFNRQPTLHKYSLMTYEVVIGKQDTIGLHLAVTPPHNADLTIKVRNR